MGVTQGKLFMDRKEKCWMSRLDLSSVKLAQPKRMAMTRGELAHSFGLSMGTVDNRIKEIEEEIKTKRYGPHSVMRDVGLVLVNPLVFADYLTYRNRLRNKNLRKNVPAYNALETASEFQLQTKIEEC